MWQLVTITNPTALPLWCSDGLPLTNLRGGSGSSSRFIVGGQGFLDVTDFQNGFPYGPVMDFVNFNGQTFNYTPNPTAWFNLTLPGDNTFTVQAVSNGTTFSGTLKPLPTISTDDMTYLIGKIAAKYVPYQNIPGAPGKTTAQITALGLKLFPWTPYSFELAMAIYDWTTASFTRMVLLKIFEYTSIGQPPYPLDQNSLATAIWESNWGTYNPQNADYMRSFLMQPAQSLADVQSQLSTVATELQEFSEVENRILAAAFQSMPRTAFTAKPQLFSGQMDIYQLGMVHFGIEFLECPLNSGPIGTPLTIPFDTVVDTYAAPGQVITTKMVWSFGDSMSEAMTYQNGIVLVVNPSDGAWVWDSAAYITPLSDDPTKIEYTFAPGTQFLVQSVVPTEVGGKTVTVITMQVA